VSLSSEIHNWFSGGKISRTAKVHIVLRISGLTLCIGAAFWFHPIAGVFFVGLVLSIPPKD